MTSTSTEQHSGPAASLVVDHLSHSYGDIVALRQVSAIAQPGKITALLGPNAAGKSTLLRCIIGAIKPTSGRVLLDGKPTHGRSPYHLAQRMAYVPQRSTVAAAFTVREVVELGRYVLPRNHHRIELALQRMELTDLVDRPYAALSVGQQQRVTLARALAQLPNSIEDSAKAGHLILDEPVSAMDLKHVRDVVVLLRELTGQGVTIIMAMHDLTRAADMADDVWLMDEGTLIAGTACDVLTVERLQQVYGVPFEWLHGRLLTVND